MTTLSQFMGGRRVAAITNFASAGGVQQFTPNGITAGINTPQDAGVKHALSGALTANTLATALSITGRGSLNFAAVGSVDATSRTVRIKVTIDGMVVFDATSSTITAAYVGLIAVGAFGTDKTSNVAGCVYQPIRFSQSCLVEIASSLSETNKIGSMLNYEVDV